MNQPNSTKQSTSPKADPGKNFFQELQLADFNRTLRRDLQELYDFYVDEEQRARLRAMHPIKRWFLLAAWLLKGLFLKLTPARRIMLLFTLILFIQGQSTFRLQSAEFSLNLQIVSFLVLLVILMLELKDKLLAHDELRVGRAVQLALLPTCNPVLPGWDIWLYTRPANDVGGDLVDYLPLRDQHLGLALGDVAGKGLGAALLMAKLQATLRALAPEAGDLRDLGQRLNTIFCRDGLPNRFATAVYLEIGPNDGQVRLLNAGHPPPIVIRSAGLEELPPVATPLGVLSEETYVEQSLDLAAGDMLVVYSDGLSEAGNRAGHFYGEERIREALPRMRGRTAADAGARLLAEVDRFIGEARPNDDLSLIVLKRTA